MLTILSIDNSKVIEPPETPAHLFAFRAFKGALFGTPAPDEDDRGAQTSQSKHRTPNRERSKSDVPKVPTNEDQENGGATEKADIDVAEQVNASPTKSILVTPGTTTNRRKTVSFGAGVVDNERKRDEPSANISKTPTNPSSSLTNSQWTSDSSDGKDKPRSRLMQTLLDARENSSKNAQVTHSVKADQDKSTKIEAKTQAVEEADDDTVNLNEPRSQSGKYWKTEFESYRMNTNREIKKLIQYRRAAKLYAKKKDEEASRLADKIREEESKVKEMERRVSQLASVMASEGAKADREQLIQELTKQTALALQYKHQVKLLRGTLERHGVVTSDIDAIEGEGLSSEKAEDLRKTRQALGRANAKIEEMKRQQSDLERLQDLVQSSEKKASALEKENSTLKQTIARYKQEMTKYEDRRKERETKLKQRESRLESRYLACRERLKKSSQQHRESEEALKKSFNEERRRMQEQIDLLRLRISAIVEHFPNTGTHDRYSYGPQKGYTGVHVHDFGLDDDDQRESSNEDDDYDEPPSPSPRSKGRGLRHSRAVTADELDMRRAARTAIVDDDDEDEEVMINFEDTPAKTPAHCSRSHHVPLENTDIILPSSPPELPPIRTSTRPHAVKYKPDPDIRRTYLAQDSGRDGTTQPRPQRSHSRRNPARFTTTLDASSGLPIPKTSHMMISGGSGKTPIKLENIPPERLAVALASLRRKAESRKAKQLPHEGKENIRGGVC